MKDTSMLNQKIAKTYMLRMYEVEYLHFARDNLNQKEITIVRDALRFYYGSKDPYLKVRQKFLAEAFREAGMAPDPEPPEPEEPVFYDI